MCMYICTYLYLYVLRHRALDCSPAGDSDQGFFLARPSAAAILESAPPVTFPSGELPCLGAAHRGSTGFQTESDAIDPTSTKNND